ncbi:Uncharacterised protein [Mycobacterium tuberculosis]|nr:Uncharacterised protein [Mycobacterium tuberculosis]
MSASAPLHGGELTDLVTSDLVEFIHSGSAHVAAVLAVVALLADMQVLMTPMYLKNG